MPSRVGPSSSPVLLQAHCCPRADILARLPAVMDPRMDSGASVAGSSSPAPAFAPKRPLLPEEVCWILDRAMACEVRLVPFSGVPPDEG